MRTCGRFWLIRLLVAVLIWTVADQKLVSSMMGPALAGGGGPWFAVATPACDHGAMRSPGARVVCGETCCAQGILPERAAAVKTAQAGVALRWLFTGEGLWTGRRVGPEPPPPKFTL